MTCEPAHVLVVEDEPHIAVGLRFNLEAEGYRVTVAGTGEEALERWDRQRADLVVLDVMLPGIDGVEVCRRIRRDDPRVPVLMLTARSEAEDRVAGLASGADDYLTKPFHLDELLLRIRGMLRRSAWYRPERRSGDPYRFGDNQVFLDQHRAVTPRGEVALTDLEARTLRVFFEREGRVLSRAELLETVWHLPADAETRTLDNFVVRLRRYFEPDPARPVHFLTVRGRGYRFQAGNGQG